MDIRIQCFKLLGAGNLAIGLVGAGTGVGIVFGSLIQAVTRNLQQEQKLFCVFLGFAILGFVKIIFKCFFTNIDINIYKC